MAATIPGCATQPIRAVIVAEQIHTGPNSKPVTVRENISFRLFSAACRPENPPHAANPKGTSNSDISTMSGPCSDSVTIVARNPPAKPYVTKTTVIA